jgi:transcription factor SPN1
MEQATREDHEARNSTPKRPALARLRILPEVRQYLNRNGPEYISAILDPDINILKAVKEYISFDPTDATMPAYDIQRDMLDILGRLPLTRESMKASMIGKPIKFYSQHCKVLQPEIKRKANILFRDWERFVLRIDDNLRVRNVQTREYDPAQAARNKGSSQAESQEQRRARQLAAPQRSNRARVENSLPTYTVAPVTQTPVPGRYSRAPGAASVDAVRRILNRNQPRTSNRRGN